MEEILGCPECERDCLFERLPCPDGHGVDCPDVVCVDCGTVLVVGLLPLDEGQLVVAAALRPAA